MKDFRPVSVPSSATLRDAMAVIDRGALEIALVVDHGDRLLGTVTDGDIRRALLRDEPLESPVSTVMNTRCTVVARDASQHEVLALMRTLALKQVPVVDAGGTLIGLHVLHDLLPRVPLSEPFLDGNERAYLMECVDTNFLSSVGPFVSRFEREFAAWIGSKHAVSTCTGTAAIHVALLLAGVGPGDDVLVSTLTFIASANPIRYLGANPVFIDAEPRSWNLDPDLVANEVRRRAGAGRPPKAILAVHVYGQPADLEPILDVAAEFGIPVLEDAAESLGATCRGRQVGTFGMTGCFSFNGNKVITSGGGGMLVTDDEALALRARHLTTQARLPGLEYQHDEVGYNYRLTNLQAALGLAQLEQLHSFLDRKRVIARRYDQAFAAIPGISTPVTFDGCESSQWMYSIRLDPAVFGATRDELLGRMRDAGIEARPAWTPIHTMPIYAGCERAGGHVAESIFANGLSLPSSAGLSEVDQQRVIACVRSANRAVHAG